MRFDILILGGGVIGLACARALHGRHPGLAIGILDAPAQAMPASLAAAGMLAPWSEFPEASPLGELCVASHRMYLAFVAELARDTGVELELEGAGTLVPDVAFERERFEGKLAAWRARGVEHEIIEGAALRAAEPALSPAVARAARLPERIVNPRRLHGALRADAARRGVQWVEGRASARIQNGDRVEGLVLDDGRRVECETLVAATGAWTRDVAELLDLRFDVAPVKGQMLLIEARDGLLNHVVHLKSVYLAPRAGAGIVVGSTMEERGFDATVDEHFVREFRARAVDLVPELAGKPTLERWAGHRPRSSDGLPILGRTPRWSNAIVATGHFRNGILLTPATGEIVARLYDDAACATWAEFSPARFAGASA